MADFGTNGADLVAVISAQTRDYDKAMDRASQKMDGFGNKINAVGRLVSGGILTKAVADLGKNILVAAENVEEMESKFKVSFDNLSSEAEKWAETYSKAVGRGKYETMSFLADNQDLFSGLGATTQQAMDMSIAIQKLGVDLASFQNIQDADAINRLTKGLMGETQNLKVLGIYINQAALQREAIAKGYSKNLNELDELTKFQLRYEIALRQRKKVEDDAINTVNHYTNRLKALKGSLQDLSADFGALLIPLAEDVVNVLQGLVNYLDEMDDETKKAILTIGGFIAVLGPLSISLSGLVNIVTTLKPLMAGLGTSFLTLNPYLLGTAAAIGVVAKAWMDYKVHAERAQEAHANAVKSWSTEDFNTQRQQIEEIDKLMKDLGDKANKAGLDISFDTAWLENSNLFVDKTKEVNLTLAEQAQKIKELTPLLKQVEQLIRKDYETYDAFLVNLNKYNSEVDKQNSLMREQAEAQERLNAIRRSMQQETDYIINLREELKVREENRAKINESINAYKELQKQQEYTSEDIEVMKSLMDYLNKSTGENLFTWNENKKVMELNEKAVKDFNKQITQTIAQSRNKITFEIETVINRDKELLSDVKQKIAEIENSYKILESGINTDGIKIKLSTEFKDAKLQPLLDQQKIIEESIAKSEEEAKKAREESVQSALDYVNKITSGISKASDDKAREAEIALQNRVNSEIRMLDYRFNTEKIKQEELIASLKANLSKYADYYNKHLNEELAIRERIYQLEKEAQQKYLYTQQDYLEKANSRILEDLNKRRQKLEENHKEQLKRIDEEKNAQIKALRKVVDEREMLLNDNRSIERIEEINNVLESFRASTTAEGQQRYKELLREREDLELKLQKNNIQRQEELINLEAELQKDKVNNLFETQKTQFQAEENVIANNYKNLLNELQGITEEATNKIEVGIQSFKEKLTNGIENALINSIPSNSLNVNIDTTALNNIKSLDIPKLMANTSLTDRQVVKDAVNYITNNNNINIKIDKVEINGKENSNEAGQQIGDVVVKQIQNGLKEAGLYE